MDMEESTPHSQPDDWIFASRVHQGCRPMWPGTVLQKIIQPAALKAGIGKHIGWHTFRHTYSTLLIANGENVKVVQELMRHASSHFTLQFYSHAQARTNVRRNVVWSRLFSMKRNGFGRLFRLRRTRLIFEANGARRSKTRGHQRL